MKRVRIADLVGRFKRRTPQPQQVAATVPRTHESESVQPPPAALLQFISEQAREIERPGPDASRPRVLVVLGHHMWEAGQVDPVDALQKRFPELKNRSQAETAAEVLRDALRSRRALRRREQSRNSWVMAPVNDASWTCGG